MSSVLEYSPSIYDTWRRNERLLLCYLINARQLPTDHTAYACEDEILSRVRPSDIYSADYQYLYSLLRGMYDANKSIDITTVVQECQTNIAQRRAKRQAIPFDNVIITITDIANIENIVFASYKSVIDAVLTASRSRAIRDEVVNQMPAIMAGDQSASAGLLDRLADIQSSTDVSSSDDDAESEIAARTKACIDYIDTPPAERAKNNIYLGWKSLNCVTMPRGSMFVVAGETGSGKSVFASDVARKNCIKFRHHVAYFSLEMSNLMLQKRMLAAEARLPANLILNGYGSLSANDRTVLLAAGKRLADGGRLHLIDTCNSIDLIENKCRVLHAHGKLDLVIIDHLQLVHTEYGKSPYDKIRYITGRLKQLALRYKVVVLVLSQLNRSKDNRLPDARKDNKPSIPSLTSLRDSGSIEQDSDGVLVIHRPFEQDADGPGFNRINETIVLILKNRWGRLGSALLLFDGNFQTFHGLKNNNFQSFSKMSKKEQKAADDLFNMPNNHSRSA